jgi:hypothetical protein
MKRKDTPLASTPEPISGTVKSRLISAFNQKNNKSTSVDKKYSSFTKEDGSSTNSLEKQTEKSNGKIKYKSYNVSTDKKGTPSRLEINKETNTGNSNTRVITNPKKIERKMARVIKRNNK